MIRTLASKRAARGFTLVELVLIISILGLLVVIAVPDRSAVDEVSLRSAARRLASDIRYAQGQSIARRIRHGVRFELAEKRYEVVATGRGEPIEDPGARGHALVVSFKDPSAAHGVTLVSASFDGAPEVSFDYFGVPSNVAGREIRRPGLVVLACGGMTSSVEIAPGTGKVTVR
ncbi:MAG TPA: prepilin-type N-terminal cleavage/methylation domain-containing protein [Candidatus Eisenbacteria bacterium]|nr:prepilin-type N-terminal cleavage/methylation domain-containing protein [Candidatus Eisenbacteria bacterium]